MAGKNNHRKHIKYILLISEAMLNVLQFNAYVVRFVPAKNITTSFFFILM